MIVLNLIRWMKVTATTSAFVRLAVETTSLSPPGVEARTAVERL